MSVAHPPSVLVSSTCYDLAQVRQDIKSFFEYLGMNPILSEFSSFPVDPNRGANLEYLEAKAKGIPRYVFVQKPILTALSIWQKNRSGDFSGIVDSPKLFEFVDSLRDPNENWVFPFDSAQDIITTLRSQLAYLFMDALTIRAKVLRCGLPEALQQDLSSAALLLVVQKPYAWEYRLFGQVLRDEMSRVACIKKDLNYGLALGKAVRLGDPAEVLKFAQRKMEEMQSYVRSGEVLFNKALPKAFGAPGVSGDIEEIIYATKRLAEVYRSILEWTLEFRHIQVKDKFSRLLELIAQMSHNAIDEIEAFVVDINKQLDDAVRKHEETKQPQSLNFTLKLTIPDMTEFNNEFRRLQNIWFK